MTPSFVTCWYWTLIVHVSSTYVEFGTNESVAVSPTNNCSGCCAEVVSEDVKGGSVADGDTLPDGLELLLPPHATNALIHVIASAPMNRFLFMA